MDDPGGQDPCPGWSNAQIAFYTSQILRLQDNHSVPYDADFDVGAAAAELFG